MAQLKTISNETDVFSWLEGELLRGQLRLEAASLSQIMDCLDVWRKHQTTEARNDVYQWDSWLFALRDSEEVRSQHRQMGKSLCQLLAELDYSLPDKSEDLTWPIAWSWAGLGLSLTKFEGES